MILYIAEKPSLARAIVQGLPKPHKSMDGFIVCGNGDHVSWCVGHLLEQAQPDAYDVKFKKWQMADLPIVPTKWQLQEKKQTKKQLSVLRKLVKTATSIIHAGDPDRALLQFTYEIHMLHILIYKSMKKYENRQASLICFLNWYVGRFLGAIGISSQDILISCKNVK